MKIFNKGKKAQKASAVDEAEPAAAPVENKPAAEEGVDMTELAAAIAMLNGEEPPSAPVIVPASIFPDLAQTKKKEAARKAAHPEPGDQMPDGTFYLGRFKGKDEKEKDWFAAAEDVRDKKTGKRLLLDFNQAATYAACSQAHDSKDWRVPPGKGDCYGNPDILGALFNNRAKIKGFDETGARYWSSTPIEYLDDYAKVQWFVEGDPGADDKRAEHPVRFVRSVPV